LDGIVFKNRAAAVSPAMRELSSVFAVQAMLYWCFCRDPMLRGGYHRELTRTEPDDARCVTVSHAL
jgi:hypothetical protein